MGSVEVEVVAAEEEPRDRGTDLAPLRTIGRRARRSKARSSPPREARSNTRDRNRTRILTISSTTMDLDPSIRE